MPFSYLVGSVIFAAALWVTLWITVSTPGQYFAGPASPSSTGILPVEPSDADQPPPVGRITGTVDCRWADSSTARMGVAVPLGGKYALASGLMEMCYNTGAKVILEGPCAYEVDSPAGGFLSLGKLTARVEEAVSDQRSAIRNLQISKSPHLHCLPSALPPPSLPTWAPSSASRSAREGNTTSHVFRGSVRVNMPAATAAPQEIVLRQDESAGVEKG